jgi:hypothetical protein
MTVPSKQLFILVSVIAIFFGGCKQTKKTRTQCDRACLENFINEYINAVIAHNPALVPLSSDVKYTENGQRLEPGDGMWNTASGWGIYKLYVADPEAGQAGFIGTIKENGVSAILALRLKIEKMEISEIEAFIARSDSEAIKLDAIAEPNPVFLETVSPSQRLSRDSLKKIANMYFTGLQRNDGKGIYPLTDDCNRLENGHYTTNNPKRGGSFFDINGMGCREQFETGFFNFVTRIRDRRFPVVDEERGLVLTFAFFDHAGNVPTVTLTDGITFPIGIKQPFTWEIAELFKIEEGLIREIQAVYQEAPYGMGTGWSTWEQTLSSEPNY